LPPRSQRDISQGPRCGCRETKVRGKWIPGKIGRKSSRSEQNEANYKFASFTFTNARHCQVYVLLVRRRTLCSAGIETVPCLW
jgi:hypothetical protein